MTNYAKGRSAEYEFMNKLRAQGYEVIRSAGSHSPADLVAFKCGEVVIYQIKSTKKQFAPKVDLAQFKLFAPRLKHVLAVRIKGGEWLLNTV